MHLGGCGFTQKAFLSTEFVPRTKDGGRVPPAQLCSREDLGDQLQQLLRRPKAVTLTMQPLLQLPGSTQDRTWPSEGRAVAEAAGRLQCLKIGVLLNPILQGHPREPR